MDHAAAVLGIPPHEVREINLNHPGDKLLAGCYLSEGKGERVVRDMWPQMMKISDYIERRKQIDAFNAKSATTKRGIAIIPLKNAVNYEEDFMNQVRILGYRSGPTCLARGTSRQPCVRDSDGG